ncbi:tyrosine-type recombinase/integrase [Kitasatospora sp. NPDC018623]|uniref:tyrosine-type recombinase/integrase n=1 Tax=unclassified Kitasatospora TaxID=2633591 RepID=UPI0037A222E4
MHDLRHTAASIMIAEGIPLAIVSKTLRHTTLATTINLYGHLFKDSADQAVNPLARALDQAPAGPAPRPPVTTTCRSRHSRPQHVRRPKPASGPLIVSSS